MATAGEDAAAAAGAYGGGGAGGKFRKRPFRKAQTTPYDRPPTALRNPSWLSKLVVDPASKLINAGARRFFASFFRKALPSLPPPPPPQLPAIPAPPPSETAQDPKDVQHQASGPNNHAGGSEPDVHKHGDAAYNHEGSGFSELEQLLKQKTLTRSEIDQLTELLHSKTVDSPLGDAGKRIEVSKPASDISRGLLGDNKTENGASHGFTSNAIISSKMCEDDVATPADLAKTYMGSRQSKVSPSVQSFRSQTVREVVPFVSQSPTMSLAKKPGIFGVTENGFTTPKSRGRSAVYNMARTPYSRVHASDFQKGGSSTNYLYTGASSSHSKLEFDELFGSKQVSLKRRSTVLDDDLGSIGPMRRIRQKSNLLYSNNGASLPTRGVGVVSVASKHQLFPTKEISKTLEKNNGSATPSTSCFLVPTKSSETAAKILEHIDKLSPKEKPSESKRAAIKERFPPKLTTNMLHGQALRSLERLDSSRLLQSTSNSYEPENHVNATLPDASDSKLLKVGSVEEIRPINFVDTVNHVANSEVAFPGRDAPAFADSIHPKFAALPAEKKCSFKMSAPEDFLELDDDIESNGHAPKPLSEGKGKQEMPLVNTKSVYSEELSQNKTAASPEINTPPGFFTKRTDEQTPNGVNTSAKYNGLSANVDLQAGKMNSANGTEIKGSSLALTGSKLESLSSPSNTASGPTDAWPRLPMDDNSLKAGINGKLEAPSVASSSTTTASLFAASSSYLSNGKISPNPVLSSSVLATSNSESHDITTVSSMAAPSISATTTNASATSSVFGPPIVKPGSSIFPSTSFSTPSTASNSGISDLNAKSEKLDNGTSLGDLKSSSFAGTSSAGTNTIFGLNSTSTATQPQGSLFSTGGGSIASAKPLFPQSGNTTSPQTTMSSLFGSSTSSPVSGTSGVASFNSLNANAPASKPLDSSGPTSAASPESNQVGTSSTTSSGIFAFGATSALPATSSALPSNGVTTVSPSFGASPVAPPETKVLGPSTGTTSALFSFGASSTNAGPAVSSFGISSAASTSTSSTPVFGFSGSSVASSLSNTTPGVVSFGGRSVGASSSSSTTPAVFGFGGSSAASSSGNTTTTAVFGFGGSSASSTSGTTAPAVFGFGGSSAASSSGTTTTVFGFGGNSASSTSGTTTPAVFGFGGSSASPSSGTTTPAVFGFGGSSAASSTTVVSNTTPGTFNFGGSSSASSQASQGSAVTGIFGSNQPPSGFNFGASSSSFSTSNTSPMPFGSTPGASSNPVFGFGTVSSTSSSQPIFGNPAPSTPSIGSNDQMTMEDSMAEDPVQQQSSSLAVSVFGQPSISPAPAPAPVSSFVFGSPNPNLNPFQFGGQQNQAAPQNPSPFQASGSLEFNGGGSFSLGSNGPDKSGRKIVKVNRNKNRRK